LQFERQRARDEAAGMGFADVILANYRRERLFSTQGHPDLALSRLYVARVFEAIGVPMPLVDQTARAMQSPPFPTSELPIHPGVAAILGLEFVGPADRYRYFDEGRFSFAEYAARYLRQACVPEMAAALDLLRVGDLQAGLPLIREALRQCPGTASAWQAFAQGLLAAGALEEAEAAIRHALDLGPPAADILAAAARVLTRRGHLDAAEAMAGEALERFPDSTEGHRALARVLARRGRHAEAAAVMRLAAALDPAELGTLLPLARHLRNAGRPEEAEAVLRQALALDPANAGIREAIDALRPPPAAVLPRFARHVPATLAALAADAALLVDGQPIARRLGNLPGATVAVPPLAFGETNEADAGPYSVSHPAAPAWLLRNVTVYGPSGIVAARGRAVAETLAAVERAPEGSVMLPAGPPAAELDTAFHLLGPQPDEYPHWLLDLTARFGTDAFATLLAQPGAAPAPIVLLPSLNTFWKWESIDVILPPGAARFSVVADAGVFVQRLLYVPALGGPDWATHPGAGALFDALRDRVAGPAAAAQGRRLFIRGGPGLANEDELAAQAERAGFTTVASAALPFAEQLRLFASAAQVVAAHGPALANLAFCRPGTVVCELRPAPDASRVWRHLAALRGLRYGRATGRPEPDGRWRLDPARFGELLG
jgi:tetratricopeptide (TPR) repeat protein